MFAGGQQGTKSSAQLKLPEAQGKGTRWLRGTPMASHLLRKSSSFRPHWKASKTL